MLDGEPYHVDGQIRDEDYEYGSFLQSRMHREGVRCTDCHDPHSTHIKVAGNKLCIRCHTAGNTTGRRTSSPRRIQRLLLRRVPHAAKNYMIVDPRRDHSIECRAPI